MCSNDYNYNNNVYYIKGSFDPACQSWSMWSSLCWSSRPMHTVWPRKSSLRCKTLQRTAAKCARPAAVSVVERVIVVDLVLVEQQKSLCTLAHSCTHTHSLRMTRVENATFPIAMLSRQQYCLWWIDLLPRTMVNHAPFKRQSPNLL